MWASLLSLSRRLTRSQSGNVAIIFSLCLLPLAGLAGAAIDFSRVSDARTRLQNAADGAALMTARALSAGEISQGAAAAFARTMFDTNLTVALTVSHFDVRVDDASGAVIVMARTALATTLMRVLGQTSVDINTLAEARMNLQDVELSLMLDVTGSMGGTKIADLRAAASDLVDILMPNGTGAGANSVRIGLVPFNNMVNPGVHAPTVTGLAGARCVYERGGLDAFTQVPPDASRSGTLLGGVTNAGNCPSSAVMPLSDDASVLKSAIGALSAGGSTAGHLGVAWSWYLLSPQWASLWPASAAASYDPDRTLKVAVLMTDGEFNTWYVGGNGNSSRQSRELCDEMKAGGTDIVIYAVAFQAPPAAQATLSACASDAAHYFNAANGTELRDAFAAIAGDVSQLRLSR